MSDGETMRAFADKKALVTGGSRGIGRAVCLELARRGADVAFIYHSRDAEAEATAAQIRGLGGNPDGKSEMAQLEMEEGRGIETIICDGHSNAVHLLHALLAAELADNAGWDVLVKLADEAGDPAAKIEFARRMAEEAKHLLFIRELVVRSAETMMLGAERPLPRGFGSVAASKMKKPLLVGGALGAVLLGVGALAASALFLARPKLAPRLRHAL